MKLYTEEQLIKAMRFCHMHEEEETLEEFFDLLTPIELPSDEIVEQEADISSNLEDYSKGFAMGAHWILDMIKQQDNDNAN